LPTLGTLNASSTVDFSQNATVVVPSATYGNLRLTNGTKTFASGTITVAGNLTVDNVANLDGAASPFTTINLAGNFSLTNGTAFVAAATNRMTLVCNGSSAQTINGGGNEIGLFRLTVNNSSGVVLSSGTTNLNLGNTSGGGVTLTSGTLSVNSNTITFYSGGKAVLSGSGTFTTTTGSSFVFNQTSATAAVGTLNLTSGSQSINNLTINLANTSGLDTLALGSAVNDMVRLPYLRVY